jgi:hypothetical protein
MTVPYRAQRDVLQDAAQNFLPHAMANSMTAVKPLAHTLAAGLLCSTVKCPYPHYSRP